MLAHDCAAERERHRRRRAAPGGSRPRRRRRRSLRAGDRALVGSRAGPRDGQAALPGERKEGVGRAAVGAERPERCRAPVASLAAGPPHAQVVSTTLPPPLAGRRRQQAPGAVRRDSERASVHAAGPEARCRPPGGQWGVAGDRAALIVPPRCRRRARRPGRDVAGDRAVDDLEGGRRADQHAAPAPAGAAVAGDRRVGQLEAPADRDSAAERKQDRSSPRCGQHRHARAGAPRRRTSTPAPDRGGEPAACRHGSSGRGWWPRPRPGDVEDAPASGRRRRARRDRRW